MMLRHRRILGVSCVAIATVMAVSPAQAQRVVRVDIKAQPLGPALRLLGRDADLTREQQLELRLEQRLANLQAEIERAHGAGDDDAAQAAHARYIELGTTFVRRFVLVENGRRGTAD